MQERIDSIRQEMDGIRKSGKLPHWRMVYADALLTRAQEYVAIDRAPEALRVLDKLDRWVDSHKPKIAENGKADFTPMTFWNAEMLTDVVNRIRKTLSAKGPLIPSTERESVNRRLKVVEHILFPTVTEDKDIADDLVSRPIADDSAHLCDMLHHCRVTLPIEDSNVEVLPVLQAHLIAECLHATDNVETGEVYYVFES